MRFEVIAKTTCIVAVLLFVSAWIASCSNGSFYNDLSGNKDTDSSDTQNEEGQIAASLEAEKRSTDLDEILSTLDATSSPPSVTRSVFEILKTEFRFALIESAFGNGGRFVSRPPVDENGRVLNLAYSEETGLLSWTYANRADYDMNGEVGVPDITPIASNYLRTTGTDPLLNWIDGSWDGEVGIPDITPIAENYLCNVAKYSIVTCSDVNGTYHEIGQISFDLKIDAIPPRFEIALPEGAEKYIRVRPVDSEGNPGMLSNYVQALIPQIESVSPLGGNEGSDVTFSAVVSGGGTYAYTWNFGGGANPDTSTEESPTVTLLDGGTYNCSLVVETEFGITQYDFYLNVNSKTYTVSGNVTFEGNPLPDVAIEMTGQTPQTTDAEGNYSFTGILNGDYTITPVDSSYEFDPPSRDVTVFKADYTGVDFTASPGLFDVSGQITNDETLPLSDVAVQLSNGTDNFDTFTQADGTFAFSGIPNGTYTITPSDTYMLFTPNTLEVTGDGNAVIEQDFLAEMTHPDGNYPFRTGNDSTWVIRFVKNTTVEVYVADGTGINGYQSSFYQSAKDGMVQWNAVADRWGLFHLAFTDNPTDAEISVSWVQTLGGNTAGVAQWSVKDNKLEIPITVKIATFVGMNQQTAQSVHDVTTHEVGHALGIWDHSDVEQDVMFPISYTGTPSKRDEYTMYVVYHTPATYTNDQGKRGGIGEDITWTME